MDIARRVVSLAKAVEERYHNRTGERDRNLRAADKGDLVQADRPERVYARFAHVQATELKLAQEFDRQPSALLQTVSASEIVSRLAQERAIGRDDLVPTHFLRRALAAARCVCRITVRGPGGSGYGTGMLVGPSLLLTNNHVLQSAGDATASYAGFDYDDGAADERVVRFNPGQLFVTDRKLDFTLVALATTDSRGRPISDIGYVSLNPNEGKAINGEYVNIIQHPGGGPKMLAVRENRIVDVLEQFLHYAADTAPGSSGAPVFNDQFEIVALHHSGVPARKGDVVLNRQGQPWDSDQGEHQVQWIANEGIRISQLVQRARALVARHQASILEAAFDPQHSLPTLGAEQALRSPAAPASVGRPGQAPWLNNGVATWTIPLSVSVSLGALGSLEPAPVVTAPAAVDPSMLVPLPVGPAAQDANNERGLMLAVEAAKSAFQSIPNVLEVRSGWKFIDGWITNTRAIVVIVSEKLSSDRLEVENFPSLPLTFQSYSVDVRQASAEELLEYRAPDTAVTLTERIANPTYEKPVGLNLPRVHEHMRVRAHVSPDYGWDELKNFLSQTKKNLLVAMYDFGAPHIGNTIAQTLKGNDGHMQLIIQYGETLQGAVKADDRTDQESIERIKKDIGDSLTSCWASVGQKDSVWASAYHIKVAVRDEKAIWLSSGNWQSSNQPMVNHPLADDEKLDLLKSHNREWHVIIENATIARVFTDYIHYDMKLSEGFKPKGLADDYELLPAAALDVDERTVVGKFFGTEEVDDKVDVQVVLTPDNYIESVLPLIESATESLYIQNQYIKESKDERATDTFVQLVEAVAQKQREGLDVRIILRADHGVEARHIEFLKDHGIDLDQVRWRNHTHTKGIIVDGKRVLCGSHNWSFDGTVLNRDASLIFYNAKIAGFFRKVFIYDWENLTSSRVSIRKSKPKIEEVATIADWKALRDRVVAGEARVRSLLGEK